MEKVIDPEVHKKTSECREHSRNSRIGEKATDEETSRKNVHQTWGRDAHPGNSESREHSQNSRKKQAEEDIGHVKVTVSVEDNKCPVVSSDFLEHSQNSLSSDEPELDKGEVNVTSSECNGQCLAKVSEFRELSSNSCVESECSEDTEKEQHTKPVCISEPSEFSWDSLGGVGSNVSVPSFSWFKSMSQIVGLRATWQQDKVEGNPMGASTASNAKTNTNPVHTEFNFFL